MFGQRKEKKRVEKRSEKSIREERREKYKRKERKNKEKRKKKERKKKYIYIYMLRPEPNYKDRHVTTAARL